MENVGVAIVESRNTLKDFYGNVPAKCNMHLIAVMKCWHDVLWGKMTPINR